MSTDPRIEQIRALIQSNHFVEALAKVKELEASGVSTAEVEHAKGLCFAGLGRVSEARVIARRLKEEGHVALAHRLAEHITVEEPSQGLISDEPYVSAPPPYPAPAKSSKRMMIGAITAGAAILLIVGIVIGAQISKRARTAVNESGAKALAPDIGKRNESQPSAQQLAVQNPAGPANLTGHWQSVDFVVEVSAFKPDERQFPGEMSLKELSCFADGSSSISMQWKDGWITDNASQIRTEYFVKEMDGATFLFLPWISGDVTIRGQKPKFYVLRKTKQAVVAKAPTPNVPQQNTFAQQPVAQQAATQWTQGSLDITGYWRSVDFVSGPSQFSPGSKSWQGDLFLKDLQCNADGTSSMQMTWGSGWITDLSSQYKAQYDVWSANGQTYLFLPWISGDVTIRGQKPKYYVLQPV